MTKYNHYFNGAGRLVVHKTTNELYSLLFESEDGKINDWDKYPQFAGIFKYKIDEITTELGIKDTNNNLYVAPIEVAPGINVPFPQINGLRFIDPYQGKFRVINYSEELIDKKLEKELNHYLTTAIVLGLGIELSGWGKEKEEAIKERAKECAKMYLELTTPKENEKAPKVNQK